MTSDLDFDPNKIAADLIHRVIKDSTLSVASGFRAVLTKIFDVFRKDLTSYVEATIKKCSYIKTPIINRDHPTYIYDIYVHTKIALRKQIYTDDKLLSEIPKLKSIIIAGTAGSGKTMLMRYIFLSLCKKGSERIPLFIELRNLNSFATKNLMAFIYYSIVGPGAIITEDQFKSGLKSGAFSIILDGFDEVDFDQRKTIEKQILQLCEAYPELVLIISSRPDPDSRFESWSHFHVAYVCPMEERQVIELITKVEFDQNIKRQFLKSLRDGLYASHKSFLSSPLLCIMMLVTFEQTGHIPTKRHIFYERAFEALFFLHDTAKEGVYKRKTYAKLPIDDFRNCLSAFCVVTYAKEIFSFSLDVLREQIKNALAIEKKDIKFEEFVADLIESTCLLQKEGNDYVFTHRSFQEYFASCFIARSPSIKLGDLLDQFAKRREDDVIEMAFAMNHQLLEREWIVPKIEGFVQLGSKLDIDTRPLQYIDTMFGNFSLEINAGTESGFFYEDMNSNGFVLNAIMKLYEQRFMQLHKWLNKQEKLDAPYMEKVLTSLRSQGDPRIQADKGKRKGARASYNIIINSSDNVWLIKTRVPAYFKGHFEVIKSLLGEIKANVESQKDILRGLLPPSG